MSLNIVNFYQKPGSSNLIGLKLEVGVASYFFQHEKGQSLFDALGVLCSLIMVVPGYLHI